MAAVAALAVVGVTAPAHAGTRSALVPLVPDGRVSTTVVDRATGQEAAPGTAVIASSGPHQQH